MLLVALQKPRALGSVLEQDPLAEAKLRGQLRRKELLEAEGGVIGPEEFGNLLGNYRSSCMAMFAWEAAPRCGLCEPANMKMC